MRRRRRRRSRLLGVLLLLVLLEVALQVASPIVQRAMERRDVPPSADTEFTVLCVGDSNTYGLNVPQPFAYPGQLAGFLARRFRGTASVVNHGVPGYNTAQVAQRLPGDLAATHPDVVCILAGINDTWNSDAEVGGPFAWLGRLKLVRLLRVLTAGVTTAEPFEVRTDEAGEFVDATGRVNAGEGHVGTRTGDALRDVVRRGLTRAVEECRDAGAIPVLMTYAEFQGEFAEVAEVARAVARDEHVLLVDHQHDFQRHFAERGYEALMFNDHHPNQAGYRLMAQGIDDALFAARLVPAVRDDSRAPAERRPPERAPVLALLDDGALQVQGPSGWTYQILVSGEASADESLRDGELLLPLRADQALAYSRLEPRFSGRIGDDGTTAPVTVPGRIRAAAEGPLVAAVLLLYDPDPLVERQGSGVAAVSEAVRLP
ncbi:MAG: SGNH/GDSL hydrolase family protein [Planctomycetes bacterium]|nr:SGNH/GDSL hydrolase family protein [Planctomycetota bacterium]